MKSFIICSLLVLCLFEFFELSECSEAEKPKKKRNDNDYIAVFKEYATLDTVLTHFARIETSVYMQLNECYYQRALKEQESELVYENSCDFSISTSISEFFEIPEKDGTSLRGYSFKANKQALSIVSEDEDILYVEADQVVSAFAKSSNVQPDAPWGLSRVSHHQWSKMDHGDFIFNQNDGTGVNVYVIDTGIYIEHNEFEGRARYGKSFVRNDDGIRITDNDAADGNGHGTHCSGTIGGKTYGIAKNVSLISVRVLDSDGTGMISDILAAIAWVVTEHLKTGRDTKVSLTYL